MKKMYALIALLGMIVIPQIRAAENDIQEELRGAVYYGKVDAVARALQCGADANGKDGYGLVLGTAAYCDHVTIVQLLLDYGAKVNAKGEGDDVIREGNDAIREGRGWTPLIEAVQSPKKSAVALLLAKRADVRIASEGGQTALFMAYVSPYPNPTFIPEMLLSPDMDSDTIKKTYSCFKYYRAEEFDALTTLRFLTHHAVKKAQAEKLAELGILTQDTRGVVTQYLGHYHHVPEYPLPDKVPTDAELKDMMATIQQADKIYFGTQKE